MLEPAGVAIIFIIGGLVAVAAAEAHDIAKQVGTTFQPADLLPPPPGEGPPLPRLLLKK